MASSIGQSLYQNRELMPEEASSYRNIEATAPGVFEEGFELLAKTAGKIQHMRLETEIFPLLTRTDNKELIKSKEAQYKDIASDVSTYRKVLQTVNGQIERAIEHCSKVPQTDERVWQQGDEAVKVYDLCQGYLPVLKDWNVKGTLLEKRLDLVMNCDKKNYCESMVRFSELVNPKASSFFGAVSDFIWGSSSSMDVETERRKREELEAKLALLQPPSSETAAASTEKKN